jgi:hypothetical protein
MASEEGHHRGLRRSGHVLIGVTRELGRAHYLLATIAGSGLPAYQKALALTMRFPVVSEPPEGIQTIGKAARCREASDERSDPG